MNLCSTNEGYQHGPKNKNIHWRIQTKQSAQYSITNMCIILAVSKNCYYLWVHYPISNRDRNNILLLKQISEAHNNARQLYGYRKVHAALHAANVNCSKNRVYKIMSEAGLYSKIRRRFKATTNSNKLPIAENLLDRQFTMEHPNTEYVSYITYIRTREGWLYLILDLCSRKVVGWAMSYVWRQL